jgi:hypothetical protein
MISNNTYKSVRLLGEGYNLYYSVWCNNEHELYDLSVSFYFPKISLTRGRKQLNNSRLIRTN